MKSTKNKILTLSNALNELGVSNISLRQEERQALVEKGFVLFENILDSSFLEELRYAFEQVMRKEGFLEGRVIYEDEEESMGDKIAKQFNKDEELYHEDAQERKVENLVNKGEVFDKVYTQPQILAAVYEIFQGEFKLSALDGMEAIKGRGEESPISDEDVKCMFLLDDINEENGSLRIYPSGEPSKEQPTTDGILLNASAGSVIIVKNNVWHGTTNNNSNHNRRMVVCHFTSRNKEPKLNQLEFIRRKTYLRISEAAKYILNV